ncbi:MAG: GNAT family N-acetyltransferase [Phycisphaerales bacterium]|nr:GNAT family N-acetyltransferase [Phycisphaerales bacterium]
MPFDLQPTLQGELVQLRPLREEDWDDLYAVARDPLIWEQHPHHNRWQPGVFRAFFDKGMQSGGALVVIDRATGLLIGSSRFHPHDEQDGGDLEIGWTFLARSHWGGSYNREMKRLMLEHAFKYVDRVMFLVGASNLRSQRAMEKIGAIRTGTRDIEGGLPHVVYHIERAAFQIE